jgi:hypothetical protein
LFFSIYKIYIYTDYLPIRFDVRACYIRHNLVRSYIMALLIWLFVYNDMFDIRYSSRIFFISCCAGDVS